jgi:Zn-dependent protease
VDPRKYRDLRKGDIIVSLAGVFTNLLVAIACVIALALFGLVGRFVPVLDPSMGILQAMMIFGVQLNLILIAFNLIPIPPLDGSHVVKYLMPASWAYRYTQISRFGIIALIAVMYLAPNALSFWLDPAFKVSNVMINAVDGTVLPSTAQWLPQ